MHKFRSDIKVVLASLCPTYTDNASTVPRVGMYYATLLTAAQGSKYTHLTYAIFLRESHFATYLVL